jgi:hydrogenase maturation protease
VLPHDLLDDGHAPLACKSLVVGCGNILRGDDAVGPTLIRLLWYRGVPDGVKLVDGGTAGMDVAFQMRGAERVVIVDAAATGAEPGTIYKVPGSELENLPDLTGLHTHSFRWDHAIAFGRWLLGPDAPTDITVYLIEAGGIEPGADLTEPVDAAMRKVADMIAEEFFPSTAVEVEIDKDGYLRLTADIADKYFAASVCGAIHIGQRLSLVPIQSQSNGGHLLKQSNASGDRCVLVRELTDADLAPGVFPATWDAEAGALVVSLDSPIREASR